ncbi:MAG: winged helix-turn-helix domain-containing protein [Marinicella sp.]
MSKQYWIGGFYIDLSRNQITQNKQTQTLAPKALAVLTCLAESHGQVVSQDTLLSHVWPDTVVSPNTLQRSIAQLRKALGDDGKGQVYIKTHAKQGYSLECDVRWHGHNMQSHDSAPDHATTLNHDREINVENDLGHKTPIPLMWIFMFTASMLLVFLGIKYFSPEKTSTLSFDTIRSLTATDDKEFDATYSPDGQYIVFNRYLGKLCVNRIWAKHIETQQEILLTQEWGSYGSHDFSPDGSKLVYFATEACDVPVVQKNCHDLVSLDFNQALQSPQQHDILLQCKQTKAVKPQWVSDNNIVLLQLQSKRWKLNNYSISDNNSTDLYNPYEGNLIDYTFSKQKQMFAVSRFDNNGEQLIEMLKPDGTLLSSHLIQRPSEISKYHIIRPNFDPNNDQLIFSTGKQMFTLTYDGQVNKINLPFAERMVQPVFHPDGNRVLMIKGPYDSDVVMLSVDQVNNSLSQPYQPLERTNLGEDFGMFQPSGEKIAFWSERSGEQQVWINSDDGLQQLTQFPTDNFIQGVDWAKDGQSLMVNSNSELIQINLDGTHQAFPMAYAVLQLYQWDSEANSVLLKIRKHGTTQVVAYDLNHSTFDEITDKYVRWIQKSENGQLIFKDQLDQFWRPGPVEPQHIEILDNQGDRRDPFVIHDNTIYAINSNHQLWSYNLMNDSFIVLGEVHADVDYLTDVKHNDLLMTIQVAAKKEVVELIVSH